MTDQELKDLVATIAVGQIDLQERMRETAQRQKETDRQIKALGKQTQELGKQIGGLGNKSGSFTEGLALPSMTNILSQRFGMTTINPSVRVKDKTGRTQEIDVLAYNNGTDNTAFIVEVKSHKPSRNS